MPKRTGLPARPAGSAWDRWLLYAKSGAAWAGDEYSAFIPLFNEGRALARIDASVALRTSSGSRRKSSPFNSIRSKA
jgi:hypothetical protein